MVQNCLSFVVKKKNQFTKFCLLFYLFDLFLGYVLYTIYYIYYTFSTKFSLDLGADKHRLPDPFTAEFSRLQLSFPMLLLGMLSSPFLGQSFAVEEGPIDSEHFLWAAGKVMPASG